MAHAPPVRWHSSRWRAARAGNQLVHPAVSPSQVPPGLDDLACRGSTRSTDRRRKTAMADMSALKAAPKVRCNLSTCDHPVPVRPEHRLTSCGANRMASKPRCEVGIPKREVVAAGRRPSVWERSSHELDCPADTSYKPETSVACMYAAGFGRIYEQRGRVSSR